MFATYMHVHFIIIASYSLLFNAPQGCACIWKCPHLNDLTSTLFDYEIEIAN